MSYIKNTLLEHEKVLYEAHPHWVNFVSSGLWLLGALVLLIIGSHYSILNFQISGLPHIYSILASICGLMAIYDAAKAAIQHYTAEYAITNKRVLMKKGLISRSSIEIMISRVESIQIQQSILGRVMGFGTVLISGTGGSVDPFYRVPHPLKFRNEVQQQLDYELSQEHEHTHEAAKAEA